MKPRTIGFAATRPKAGEPWIACASNMSALGLASLFVNLLRLPLLCFEQLKSSKPKQGASCWGRAKARDAHLAIGIHSALLAFEAEGNQTE